ncbi:MAG TPA: hypothetical protein VFO83_13420 [Aggregicoccus sp.]|nr:hypothetical protein [Aggregicoccus sp.]
MTSPRPLLPVSLLAALLGMACTNTYPQQQGDYLFTATEEIVDDCELVAEPEALWDAQVLIAGETLRMDYGLFEQAGEGGTELVGFFLGVDDRFTVDGSVANVTTQVRGQPCLLDNVAVHLDGRTDCPTQFSGTLSVRYESRGSAACNCELWVKYTARQPQTSCEPAP